jgi:hypothetical protein
VGEWVSGWEGLVFREGGGGAPRGAPIVCPGLVYLFFIRKDVETKETPIKPLEKPIKPIKTYKKPIQTYKTLGITYNPIQGTLWALP